MQVTCSECGAVAESPALGWTSTRAPGGGMHWYCVACTRENSRAIESRLDEAWW